MGDVCLSDVWWNRLPKPIMSYPSSSVLPFCKREQGLRSPLSSKAIADGFGMGAQTLCSQGRNHVPVKSTSTGEMDRQTSVKVAGEA